MHWQPGTIAMSKHVTEACRMLIGGELVESESGQFDDSLDPATEEVIGRAPAATKADVDKAARAAEKAWPGWAAMSVAGRADVLRTFGARLMQRADELLKVEVSDTGNTIGPMRGDVRMGDSLNYYAGLGYELKGQTIPSTPGNLHLTVREPYGIVARIVPFNHPVMFATARTAAALMAGNAVVVKPPETSPLSAMVLAEIARDAFPPGVFNIVTGKGATAGDALVRHPAIKRIAFIGSTATGRAIQRAAAETAVKHVSLELGGKNPLIVFPDADPDAVARAAVGGMNFTWQGQSCGSTSRLLLHDSLYDRVLEQVVDLVSSLRVGDPMDDRSQMGPINSAAQLAKVQHYVAAGKADGARLLTGGTRPEGEQFRRGYWIRPAVFGGVTPGMRLASEEVFGPILSVMRWSDLDSAIAMANDVEYGLTAAIWTNDINTALTTARRVRAGHQWINGFGAHYMAVPFGGVKSSGVGREEGLEEMLDYTEIKTINIVLGTPTWGQTLRV
jgi:aldehyde dehydrogenase (NAD+)/betaine-aldehyde dehydrogenase